MLTTIVSYYLYQMPDSLLKLSRFWQELKRRNVVRRNTVYAATAFVILELVSIVQEPLNLPEWTLSMLIVVLSIGFILSIILSWIYDISPVTLDEKHIRDKGHKPGDNCFPPVIAVDGEVGVEAGDD